MSPLPQDPLEPKLHTLLRSLPNRRAPASLERRVLASLAARAALPWYRHDFRHWPLAARTAFLGLTGTLCAVTFTLGSSQSFSLDALTHKAGTQVAPLQSAWSSLSHHTASLLPSIPSIWLYSALGVILFAYLILFGLGATAYRALSLNR